MSLISFLETQASYQHLEAASKDLSRASLEVTSLGQCIVRVQGQVVSLDALVKVVADNADTFDRVIRDARRAIGNPEHQQQIENLHAELSLQRRLKGREIIARLDKFYHAIDQKIIKSNFFTRWFVRIRRRFQSNFVLSFATRQRFQACKSRAFLTYHKDYFLKQFSGNWQLINQQWKHKHAALIDMTTSLVIAKESLISRYA